MVLNATGTDNYVWNTGETGSQIIVSPNDTIVYDVVGTNQFGCSDTAMITINVFPSDQVSFSGLLPVYCQSDEASPLTGLPEGGYFTGPGMVGGVFNPELAGDGVHQIVYHYSNAYECTDSAVHTTRVFGGLTSIELAPIRQFAPTKP